MKVYIGNYPTELKCKIFDNYITKKRDGYIWEYDDDIKLSRFEKSFRFIQRCIQFAIYDPLNWLYFDRIKEQRHKIKIDYWDTWSMDYTLSFIILPMLKQLREYHAGCPITNGDDVPDELKPTEEEVENFNNGIIDKKCGDRWNYILDEMIWTFERIAADDEDEYDEMNQKQTSERINNGLRLFGKYYRALWD